jgi:hypothetical protein
VEAEKERIQEEKEEEARKRRRAEEEKEEEEHKRRRAGIEVCDCLRCSECATAPHGILCFGGLAEEGLGQEKQGSYRACGGTAHGKTDIGTQPTSHHSPLTDGPSPAAGRHHA